MTDLIIPRNIFAQIITQAQAAAPHESCGLLAGVGGQIRSIYPLHNAETANPETRYAIDPAQQFAAFNQITTSGQTLVGIYHSHPASPAHPSATDRELAFYPEAAYFICSLAEAEPIVRAFRIVTGQVTELRFQISES